MGNLESDGLVVEFDDGADQSDFDGSRLPDGCEVTDQDPPAGEVLALDDTVTIFLDCRQVDWEDQENAVWADFSDAYSTGFDDGCDGLFGVSPDGSLYEDDVEYTVADCLNLNPGDGAEASDLPREVPEDPESVGEELGNLDGCRALYDQQGLWSLNYGEESYTADDCPIDAYAPPGRQKSGAGTGLTPRACPVEHVSGRDVIVRVDTGKINCEGAVALLAEWLSRAPTEGVGSGGAMTIDGWTCVGATATEAPRIGSCIKDDGSAAFRASED